MQPLDPADSRRPYVQVAASIRAAILSGEFGPGQRLPSTAGLAAFFGVAKVTIGSAVRILREEGYVRSRAGSGIFVAEEESLPVSEGTEHPYAGLAAFLFEVGKLKNLPRAGWIHLGIRIPEDVAAHSHRASLVGLVLATVADADPLRTAAMCMLHDTQETRTGDLDAIARGYVTAHDEQSVTARQVSGLPDATGKLLTELVAEYETAETLEAQLAHDADKIELILTADEYAEQGYDSAPFRETSLPALRTEAGKQLTQAITATAPAAWYMGHRNAYERRWLRRRGNDAYLNGSR
jgi:putative hydrolases of HD superfamily